MFTKAQLYRENGKMHHSRDKVMIEQLSKEINWKLENESLIDIGCGPGDVTMELIAPLISKKFARLLATDISPMMIENAKKFYENGVPNRITFDLLNIADSNDVDRFLLTNEPFDHVTSIHCLHWIRDQHTAFKNISKLMKPNGDGLFIFVARNPLFDFFQKQAEKQQYREQLKDVNEFITPYQFTENPEKMVRELLKPFNFHTVKVIVKDFPYHLHVDELKGKF